MQRSFSWRCRVLWVGVVIIDKVAFIPGLTCCFHMCLVIVTRLRRGCLVCSDYAAAVRLVWCAVSVHGPAVHSLWTHVLLLLRCRGLQVVAGRRRISVSSYRRCRTALLRLIAGADRPIVRLCS